VQVGEALNVKHVNFVDEEDTRNQLGNALVNVLVHNLVNLLPQFVCTSTPCDIQSSYTDKHSEPDLEMAVTMEVVTKSTQKPVFHHKL